MKLNILLSIAAIYMALVGLGLTSRRRLLE